MNSTLVPESRKRARMEGTLLTLNTPSSKRIKISRLFTAFEMLSEGIKSKRFDQVSYVISNYDWSNDSGNLKDIHILVVKCYESRIFNYL